MWLAHGQLPAMSLVRHTHRPEVARDPTAPCGPAWEARRAKSWMEPGRNLAVPLRAQRHQPREHREGVGATFRGRSARDPGTTQTDARDSGPSCPSLLLSDQTIRARSAIDPRRTTRHPQAGDSLSSPDAQADSHAPYRTT